MNSILSAVPQGITDKMLFIIATPYWTNSKTRMRFHLSYSGGNFDSTLKWYASHPNIYRRTMVKEEIQDAYNKNEKYSDYYFYLASMFYLATEYKDFSLASLISEILLSNIKKGKMDRLYIETFYNRGLSSLAALNKNGIDENHKIIDAPGAIPYIENLNEEAIERFQSQIEMIDLIDVKDKNQINKVIEECISKNPSSFGESYIAIRITPEAAIIDDKRALHSKIVVDYMGKVKKRGE